MKYSFILISGCLAQNNVTKLKEYWIEFEKEYFIFKMPANLPVNHQELGRMRFISLAVVIAFLCQLVGLIGPGWIVLSSFLLNLKIGVWFALVCLGDTVCEVVSMTEYKSTTDISKYLILSTIRIYRLKKKKRYMI